MVGTVDALEKEKKNRYLKNENMTNVPGLMPFITFRSIEAVPPVYVQREMQPFLSQGQYIGASLKESWFPCARWLSGLLHAKGAHR